MDPFEPLIGRLTDLWGMPDVMAHGDESRAVTAAGGLQWQKLHTVHRRGWEWNRPDGTFFVHVDQDAYLGVHMRGLRAAQLSAPWPGDSRGDMADAPVPSADVLDAMAGWAFGLES